MRSEELGVKSVECKANCPCRRAFFLALNFHSELLTPNSTLYKRFHQHRPWASPTAFTIFAARAQEAAKSAVSRS